MLFLRVQPAFALTCDHARKLRQIGLPDDIVVADLHGATNRTSTADWPTMRSRPAQGWL